MEIKKHLLKITIIISIFRKQKQACADTWPTSAKKLVAKVTELKSSTSEFISHLLRCFYLYVIWIFILFCRALNTIILVILCKDPMQKFNYTRAEKIFFWDRLHKSLHQVNKILKYNLEVWCFQVKKLLQISLTA